MGYEQVKPQDVGSHHTATASSASAALRLTASSIRRINSFISMRLAAETYSEGNMELAEQHLQSIEQASAQVIGLIDELIQQLL